MDWLEGGADEAAAAHHQHGVDKAFTLISEGPAPAPGRTGKAAKRVSGPSIEDITRSLQLEAHPALFAGETEAARLGRAEAGQQCWTRMEKRLQVGAGAGRWRGARPSRQRQPCCAATRLSERRPPPASPPPSAGLPGEHRRRGV